MPCEPLNEQSLHQEAVSFINEMIYNLKLILQDKEPSEPFCVGSTHEWTFEIRTTVINCPHLENHPDAIAFFDLFVRDAVHLTVNLEFKGDQLRPFFATERLIEAERQLDNLQKCKTRILFH